MAICQAWLATRAAALRSTALEQRLWARTLPSVGGSTPLDKAREALYRDLARGYRDRCLRVRPRSGSGWMRVMSSWLCEIKITVTDAQRS